ncbi:MULTISPECIES: acyltransferase [Rhodomicrobium]|uniref:acyltransferase family protein n=1 Tax=Rhodomicrobium TaxID=1068 RepID=UPI000B4A6A97|nr:MULTISPECIES: acyltransferase [Rhodomicrobium]
MDRPRTSPSDKVTGLDAIRGAAAFIVFTGHFFRNFAPGLERSANGTPFYTLFNGSAAVIVFFVLSGFVLSRRPLRSGRVLDIADAAIKRWPRLAGPVLLAGFAYIFGAVSGAFPRPAQVIAGSEPYLPFLLRGYGRHAENIGGVLQEASFWAFLGSAPKFNEVLWTMHWELIGSFVTFAMALVICLRLPLLLLAVVAAAAAAHHPYLSCFPLGMIFCLLHERYGRDASMANWLAIGLVSLGLVLFSYNLLDPAGLWGWAATLPAGTQLWAWVIIQNVAAMCFMSVALYHPGLRALLSGRLGAFLGGMSFPFYLLHVFVLCSFTSWMCILAGAKVPPLWLALVLYAPTALVVCLVAYPLMRFDGWWVGMLNAAVPAARRALAALYRRPAAAR